MDLEKLELLEGLCAAASPAPWHVLELDDDSCMGALAVVNSGDVIQNGSMRAGTWPSGSVIAACLIQSPPYVVPDDDRFEANARLIAELRNTFPELLRLARKALEAEA